jgi:hypothetical protein
MLHPKYKAVDQGTEFNEMKQVGTLHTLGINGPQYILRYKYEKYWLKVEGKKKRKV